MAFKNNVLAGEYVMEYMKNPSALDVQVAGSHYKDLPIQPVEYIHANKLGYFEGNVVKYVSRWKLKNGIADLLKAKHYIELLIELETKLEKQNAKACDSNPTVAQQPEHP